MFFRLCSVCYRQKRVPQKKCLRPQFSEFRWHRWKNMRRIGQHRLVSGRQAWPSTQPALDSRQITCPLIFKSGSLKNRCQKPIYLLRFVFVSVLSIGNIGSYIGIIGVMSEGRLLTLFDTGLKNGWQKYQNDMIYPWWLRLRYHIQKSTKQAAFKRTGKVFDENNMLISRWHSLPRQRTVEIDICQHCLRLSFQVNSWQGHSPPGWWQHAEKMRNYAEAGLTRLLLGPRHHLCSFCATCNKTCKLNCEWIAACSMQKHAGHNYFG